MRRHVRVPAGKNGELRSVQYARALRWVGRALLLLWTAVPFKPGIQGTCMTYMVGPRTVSIGATGGVPFQAQFDVTTSQRPGGSEPGLELRSGTIYRDSLGRVRTDYRIGAGMEGTIVMTTISDPIAGSVWAIDPVRGTSSELPLPPRIDANGPGAVEEAGWLFPGVPSFASDTEFEGLMCQRVLLKRTEGGREEANIGEVWISRKLRQVVFERTLLGGGESTWRLSAIREGEPDKTLFIVPARHRPDTTY